MLKETARSTRKYKGIKGIKPKVRPIPAKLGLPVVKYKVLINREEYIDQRIAKIFKSSPNAKMLFMIGNNHILKSWNGRITL